MSLPDYLPRRLRMEDTVLTALLTSVLLASVVAVEVLVRVSLLAVEEVVLLFVRAVDAAVVRADRSRFESVDREDVTLEELLVVTRLFEPRISPEANSL